VAALMFSATLLLRIPHVMQDRRQAALIAEGFTGRLRYSGASLGYQLASVLAGGRAPLIAVWLFGQFKDGIAIAWYIFGCAVISFIAASMVRDRSKQDISVEYDEQPSEQMVGVGQGPRQQPSGAPGA